MLYVEPSQKSDFGKEIIVPNDKSIPANTNEMTM